MSEKLNVTNNKIKKYVKEFIIMNFNYSINKDSLNDDSSFIDNGIIDSTGVLELIDFIEEKFKIIIENDEVIPENLDSINNIVKYIKSKNISEISLKY